jgi:hypothetical protein
LAKYENAKENVGINNTPDIQNIQAPIDPNLLKSSVNQEEFQTKMNELWQKNQKFDEIKNQVKML